jgi:DNA-binding PadR family transcriptional regulator
MGNHHIPLKLSILRAIQDLGPDQAYGVAIGKRLVDYGRSEPTVGALYTTLIRLLDEELVSTHKGPPLNERGGKSRTYYSLSDRGATALADYLFNASHLHRIKPNGLKEVKESDQTT